MKPLAQNTLVQGRYLVVHLIGKGGMGEVYLAVDQRLGHPVALKRTIFRDDDAMGSAFEREARTLARLRHPALPKVSDHFTENDNQYLVMDHIAGDDLGNRLKAMGKPFPLSWVLFWADQLLEALAYLHANEPPIIHRDIKPQNLKLTEDNNIILLDFGLSKSGLSQQADPTSGSSGSVLGYTPHFAPMEQIRGTGTNPRSDIYSLSATLYQLLSNICPPDALTRADAMLSGSPDPLQPLYVVNPEVPQPVSDVIAKGMAVSQDQRHGTAREMQKYLRDAFSKMQGDMGAKTVIMDAASVEAALPQAEADFGAATMKYDTPSESLPDSVDTQPKQAEIKTEIFSAPTFDALAEVPASVEPEAPAESFAEEPASFAPEATAPAIVFEESSPASAAETPSSPFGDSDFGTPASPFDSPAQEETAAPEVEPESAPVSEVAATPAAKKSSKGMLIGILVGIVILGFLLVGGLGAAYYFMNSKPADEPANISSPSPSPTKYPSPSPEPSVEETPLGTNTANTNTTIAVPSPEPTPTPAQVPDTTGPARKPKQDQKPTQKPTPQPTKPKRQIPM